MKIRCIHNSRDHERALARLTELLESDPVPASDAAAQLEALTVMIEEYESKHFPIDAPSTAEALRFRMDQLGLSHKH